MKDMLEKEIPRESARVTWLVIFLLAGGILVKGFFTLFVVGDLGMPTWDYRPIEDVPGESPYAIYETLPYPQHVRGEKGE